MILIYATCKNKQEAKTIARHLLEKKLIACANIFPIESLYLWKGKLEEAKENVLLLKTKNNNFKKIKKEIKKIHSYEIPVIIKIRGKAEKECEKWIKGEVK